MWVLGTFVGLPLMRRSQLPKPPPPPDPLKLATAATREVAAAKRALSALEKRQESDDPAPYAAVWQARMRLASAVGLERLAWRMQSLQPPT